MPYLLHIPGKENAQLVPTGAPKQKFNVPQTKPEAKRIKDKKQPKPIPGKSKFDKASAKKYLALSN